LPHSFFVIGGRLCAVRVLAQAVAGPIIASAIMPCPPDSANDFSQLQFHDRLRGEFTSTKIGRSKNMADWRSETLDRIRKLIREAAPGAAEERKWHKPSNPAGVPVWEDGGIICTGESYKDKVKLTFARGAALDDPAGLFNSSLDGNVRRAMDIFEGDAIDADAFKALVREAVVLNKEKAAKR
jgi:hypothetical protein